MEVSEPKEVAAIEPQPAEGASAHVLPNVDPLATNGTETAPSPEDLVEFRCLATKKNGEPCDAPRHAKLAFRCAAGHVAHGNSAARRRDPLEGPVETVPTTPLEMAQKQSVRLVARTVAIQRRLRGNLTGKERMRLEDLLTRSEQQLLEAQANIRRIEEELAQQGAEAGLAHLQDKRLVLDFLPSEFLAIWLRDVEANRHVTAAEWIVEVLEMVGEELRVWATQRMRELEAERARLQAQDSMPSPSTSASSRVALVDGGPIGPLGIVRRAVASPDSTDVTDVDGLPYQIVEGKRIELLPGDLPLPGRPVQNFRGQPGFETLVQQLNKFT